MRAGKTLEARIHSKGVLLRELGDGTDAKEIEVAKHGRADGNEVAELTLSGHGAAPCHSLCVRHGGKKHYRKGWLWASDFLRPCVVNGSIGI